MGNSCDIGAETEPLLLHKSEAIKSLGISIGFVPKCFTSERFMLFRSNFASTLGVLAASAVGLFVMENHTSGNYPDLYPKTVFSVFFGG